MGDRLAHGAHVTWPQGARCAVTLSFDVDADSAYLNMGPEFAHRLSSLSQGRYGITRGLPRILDLLDTYGIKGTFYVPGYTAELYPQDIREIARSGHEIGHHGYMHERPDTLTAAQEREAIEQGLRALQQAIGIRPVGYRSPAWEITPTTLELLNEHDFLYDSSCMGNDVPYLERHGSAQIVELPVQWILDDWPQFGYDQGVSTQIADPDQVFRIWLEEFEGLYAEGGYFMLTMHPEVIGRPHRIALLERLIQRISGHAGIWWATAEAVARHSASQLQA